MAVLTLRTLRERLVDCITAAPPPADEGATGARWHESPWHYELLPQSTTQPHAHLSFALGFPQTSFVDPQESSRIRRATQSAAGGQVGARVQTRVVVRWLHRCRGDRLREDLDAAHDAEALLVAALCDDLLTTSLHLRIDGLSRRLVGDGTYLLCEVEAEVEHRLAIR